MSVGENIRNYSVKKKLRALVGVAIVYTLIITIANMVFLSIMENRSMKLYTGPYKTSQIVAYLNVEMQKLNTYAYKVISFTDEAQLMNTVKEIETTTNMIQELIQQLEECDKENAECLAGFMSEFEQVLEYRTEIEQILEEDDMEKAHEIMNTYEELIEGAQEIVDICYNNSLKSAENTIEKTKVFMIMIMIMNVVIVILMIIGVLVVSKHASGSILEGISHIKNVAADLLVGKLEMKEVYDSKDELGEMSKDLQESLYLLESYVVDITGTLEEISSGNLDISLNKKIDYRGEFTLIQNSLQQIISKLNGIFHNTKISVVGLTDNAGEIASSAQNMSESAIEQANVIEQLFSNFNEVEEQVENNKVNAKKADDFSNDTRDMVLSGNQKMKDLMNAMDSIMASSSEIAQIADTIQKIASKTHMLSLNASIEASNAGEAGKGFSVVAKQVGELASQSAAAAKHATKIIEDSLQISAKGVDLAKETGDALDAIVGKVEDTVESVKGIARASIEQADSIHEMTKGVQQISEMIQKTSSVAGGIAESTDQLFQYTQNLQVELSKYKLKE